MEDKTPKKLSAAHEAELRELQVKYNAFAKELSDLNSQKQSFLAQASENSTVLEELNALPAESKVFKMVGVVMMRDELEDAKANVRSRLELIETHVTKTDKRIIEKSEEMNKVKLRVIKIRTQGAQPGEAPSQ